MTSYEFDSIKNFYFVFWNNNNNYTTAEKYFVDSKYKQSADLIKRCQMHIRTRSLPGFGDEARIRHPGGVSVDDHIKDCTEGALREFVISMDSLLELLQHSRSSLTKLQSK